MSRLGLFETAIFAPRRNETAGAETSLETKRDETADAENSVETKRDKTAGAENSTDTKRNETAGAENSIETRQPAPKIQPKRDRWCRKFNRN